MLKRIIKEERPKQMHGKGYGMPSSHAQFVAFFSVHLTLFLLLRHRPRTFSKVKAAHTPLTLGKRAGLSAFALAGAGAVAASRIYLSYHTPKQVAVGWIAGTICAVGWFVINTCLRRTGVLDWALEQPLVRYFRVRDLCIEEDVPQAGWERWEERGVERLKRQGVPTHVHQE